MTGMEKPGSRGRGLAGRTRGPRNRTISQPRTIPQPIEEPITEAEEYFGEEEKKDDITLVVTKFI